MASPPFGRKGRLKRGKALVLVSASKWQVWDLEARPLPKDTASEQTMHQGYEGVEGKLVQDLISRAGRAENLTTN